MHREHSNSFYNAAEDQQYLESPLLNFLDYLSREEHEDLFIQIWADNVKIKICSLLFETAFDIKIFEKILEQTFSEHYSDPQPLTNNQESAALLAEKPLQELLIKLVLNCRQQDIRSMIVAMLFFSEYKALDLHSKNNEIKIDHKAAEKIFKRTFFRRFTDKASTKGKGKSLTINYGKNIPEKLLHSPSSDFPAEHTLGTLALYSNREVTYKGVAIKLAKMEYELLSLLLSQEDAPISKDWLADTLYSKKNRGEQQHNPTNFYHLCSRLKTKLIKIGLPQDLITIENRQVIFYSSLLTD